MNNENITYRKSGFTGKLRALGRVALWLLLSYGIMLAVSFGVPSALCIFYIMTGAIREIDPVSALSGIINGSMTLIQLAYYILFLLVVVLIYSQRREPLASGLGFRRSSPRITAASALFGISANVVFTFAVSVIPWPEAILESFSEQYAGVSDGASMLFSLIVFSILTAVVEEILYRAIIISKLSEAFGETACVLISALIFAVAHGNIIAGCYTFVLGIFLALVYLRCRSIIPCIVIHMMFNAAGLISIELSSVMFSALTLIFTGAAIFSAYVIFSSCLSRGFLSENERGQ